MIPVIGIVLFVLIVYFIIRITRRKDRWKEPERDFPSKWRVFLIENVSFYSSLSEEEKEVFEYKIQEFLLNCRITGIKTQIDDKDKILIASSAVIPIFKFPSWRYLNLSEVLVYPGMFNQDFETEGSNARIMGMVGTGYMEGKMILSKPAIYHGFRNESDKKNTAIHEFVHLIDKSDGTIDGVPSLLLEKQYAIPWIELINKKIDEIYDGRSDINPYGGTNRSEFFAVISEYFFERPKLLAQKHPELYQMLEQIFDQKMNSRNLKRKKYEIGRNSPCPCGSGEKFKYCCGRSHF